MKKVSFTEVLKKIDKFKPAMGGVFNYSDLFHLIGAQNNLANRRMINKLVKEKVVYKIRRGFYITDQANLWLLAVRIKPNSYISMDSVLSKNGLVGTLTQGSVSAVYTGVKKEEIETPQGIIRYFSIKKSLVFGTVTDSKGISMASNEKAYLDLLYYYNKGAKFMIDPLSEISVAKLNKGILMKYLDRYRNPKFKSFVRALMNESTN